MAYRKIKGNSLFTGTEILETNAVLVVNDNGIIKNLIPENEAGEEVEYFDGMLSPGFINCHCHLELSHLKNKIPEKTGLVDFVIHVMKQRNFPEEEILQAIADAEQEMLTNGIVAVGDICNTTHTIVQKSRGHLQYFNFVEVSGFVPATAKQRFEQAENIYAQFLSQTSCPSPYASIVPHAPYSVSKELFALINEHSAGKTISIHNEESLEENKFFMDGKSEFKRVFDAIGVDISFFEPTGKTSLQSYLPLLDKVKNILLVHNTFISEEDMEKVVSCQLSVVSRQLPIVNEAFDSLSPFTFHLSPYFVLCPNANLYIENTLPPVELLRKNNCPIALGTDSLASNHSLNILDELRVIKKAFPHIPLNELLQWATLNGAKALQMENKLGSFGKGKQPGIILIDKELKSVKRVL